MNKATADYHFYVDWDNDGDFSEPFEEITSDVRDARWSIGVDAPLPAHAGAGTCTLLLANGDSKYSPYYTRSPLWNSSTNTSYVRPGLKIQVTMDIGDDSGEVPMWTGLLETIIPEVGEVVPASTATLTANGMLSRFVDGGAPIDTQVNITTGAAVAMILDSAGFINSAEDNVELDEGKSTLARWWVDAETSRYDALMALQDEELGRIREGKAGQIIFEDRHHMTINHPTARVTYGEAPGGLTMWDLRLENPINNIYNHYKGEVASFNQTSDMPLVTVTDVRRGSGGSPIYIAAGATVTVIAKVAEDAGYISVATWSMTDLEANSNSSGTGTDVTANISATKTAVGQELHITLKNNGSSAAYVILLRAHGTAIVEGESISVESYDVESESVYHQRDYPYPARWFTSFADHQAFANFVVASYKNPRPTVSFKIMANVSAELLAEAQTIDTGDRIRIVDNGTWGLYLDDDFIVDKITHHVATGNIHTVDVVATVAPSDELGTLASSYVPYTAAVVMPPAVMSLVPDIIKVYKYPAGNDVVVGAIAWKYNETITAAELKYEWRTDRPPYVDLSGQTAISLPASFKGANYRVPGSEGRCYFAFRFMNQHGWSVWSDGNPNPTRVTDLESVEVESADVADMGPPAGWTVRAEAGTTPNTVRLRATRPTVNGRRILFAHFQLRDISAQGRWRDLDDIGSSNPAAEVHYDGSTIGHTVSEDGQRMSRNTGSGFGSATTRSLLVIDQREGLFNIKHTMPFWAGSFENFDPATATFFTFQIPLTWSPGSNYRIKFIKPPWEWSKEGYFGWTTEEYWQIVNVDGSNGDMTSAEFVSRDIPLGNVALENVRGRVFFQNWYSWSDDNTYTTMAPSTSGKSQTQIVSEESWGAFINPNVGMLDCCSVIRISFNSDALLGNLVGAVDGQIVHMLLINTSNDDIVITLGSKYRNGKAFPTVPAAESGEVNGLDILEEEEEEEESA